ncbi:flavodoxin family protein [Gluconacetobacter sp. 1b LMG 1731]|uniref:Flavodoxin family protein n=1 Tax=Gluconacetobacter dulcium TaxID=2729096 RepID=A0A7W4IP36_9PROT|nr:flavodoxin family protein [Gluconacetobacter dulcium]MBB2166490.1 flavodoxin family protein [Gluconacetobacter dulcium]MBB2195627.1 flavodoxin family protein [Gluconacetobacter dulcium]
MSKTVVIYHSGYGHTKTVAEHVARGAEAQIIAIDAQGEIAEADWDALNAADAIIFGTPTYMGNVSWQFKKFADATSKVWFTRGWQDKVFGGFTNSASPNGDKQVALITLQTLASQHGGIWVSLGVSPSNTKAATADDPNNLGGSVGLLARSPADAGADEVHKGDLETAALYGKRVAGIAARLRR